MAVYDFNNAPESNQEDFVCTYTTFHSSERNATPEQPILILDNSERKWEHYSCGFFTNQSRRTAFEFKGKDGTFCADIIQVDSRFVHLIKMVGEKPY